MDALAIELQPPLVQNKAALRPTFLMTLLPVWDLGVGGVTRESRRVGSPCKETQGPQLSKELEFGTVAPIGPHGGEER